MNSKGDLCSRMICILLQRLVSHRLEFMEKHPTTDHTHPSCYGVSHSESVLCGTCPSREKCAPLTERWARIPSLSEALRAVEDEVSAPTLGQDTYAIEDVYDQMYEQHFGRRSPRRRTPQNNALFSRVLALVLQEEVDLATWIAANMHGLKAFVRANPRIGFQPNMLLGEKAKGRYNAFIRATSRRMHRAKADAVNHKTQLGKMRNELFSAEVEVASYYVAAVLQGQVISWESATALFDLPEDWRALQRGAGARYEALVRQLGAQSIEREQRLVRLRAACAVARSYGNNVPDVVGFREFSWAAFARLMQRLAPVVPAAEVREGVDMHWGCGQAV